MNDSKTPFDPNERRYDLDYLRVGAFILLIFYHIGMYFVADWGWHVKSSSQSEFLQNLMLFSNQWRMPLIFLISGAALALVEPKLGRLTLLRIRFTRVFIPLILGMYLIVPPQLYFELGQKEGFSGSYLEFMAFYVNTSTSMFPDHQHGPLGLLTWNHLWYLAYLMSYTLIFLLISPLLRRISWPGLDARLSPGMAFFVLITILCGAGIWLKPLFPKTNALFGDWYNHALYFSVFIAGYFIAKCPQLWAGIIAKRRFWLALAIIHFSVLLCLFHNWIPKLLGISAEEFYKPWPISVAVQWIVYTNVVAWLFTLLAWAGHLLRRPSKGLAYMNEAILPWYILHQTVTIALAAWSASWLPGPWSSAILLIVGTFAICALAYELIRRVSLLRWIFGMKPLKKQPVTAAPVNQVFQ